MDDRPNPCPIALLVSRPPAWAQHRPAGVVWCATASELAVLAREGRLRAALIDGLFAGLDADLVGRVRRSCPVLVIDGPGATVTRWEAVGAAVVPTLPADEASLLAAVEAAESATPVWTHHDGSASGRGALLAVLAAPGGDGIATATSAARSLVTNGTGTGTVVLADLTLDAPHRALHGLSPDQPGLPDLIEAGRFGPTLPVPARAQHPTGHGYLVVPGLLHHHDWVTVGVPAAESALGAIRVGAELVVAHVDRDLEGESDTGSFDIEDRNALARTAVRAADLVLVAAGSDRSGRLGIIAALGALARFGVPHDRTVVVRPGGGRVWPRTGRDRRSSAQVLQRRSGDRSDPRLGTAIRARLAGARSTPEPKPSAGEDPEAILPGMLGHWSHDIDGWITPRVPQQP